MSTNIQTCTSITRPTTNLVAGDMRFETDTKNVIIWDGSNWVGYKKDFAVIPFSDRGTNYALFDGVDDLITLGGSTDFNWTFSDSWTISAWINPTTWSSTANDVIFHNGKTLTSGDSYQGGVLFGSAGSSNKLVVNWFAGAGGGNNYNFLGRITDADVISTSIWQHVVATYNGGSTNSSFKIYIDKVQSDTADSGGGNIANGSASSGNIGMPALAGKGRLSTRYFQGGMDEYAIFDYALSQSEINDLYDYTYKNPTALWRFESGYSSEVGSYTATNSGTTITAY